MKTKKYLQINNMLLLLRKGEEITTIKFDCIDGNTVTRIEGYTTTCDFVTTYYPDLIVSEWKGLNKGDIWTKQENFNIITCYKIED